MRRDDQTPPPLSPEEEEILEHCGTEPPFSGALLYNEAEGTYRCRRCGAPLFDSRTKFDSGSGWPSFDDALPEAVGERPDPDGRRTEIICARCEGHLGHVFRGEGMTPKSTRHCVNSLALSFEGDLAHAYFAGGCFWGVEYHFARAPGVREALPGYMGGRVVNPSYEQVCSGENGHAETVRVTYDPSVTSFEALARLFFEIHDPTERDRQGPDVGPQYRSAVFTSDAQERAVTERLMNELAAKGIEATTRLELMQPFYPAEDKHRRYYEKSGGLPYCHTRVKRF